VPRPLLLLVALVVVVALTAGCADDVSSAAQVGDDIDITTDDLLTEVGEWAGSPGMVEGLQLGDPAGAGEGSYSTTFVNAVLGYRIAFELHRQQFDELGLELTDQQLAEVESGIFGDRSEEILGELDPDYADQLVEDVAKQFAVTQAMGDGYEAWLVDALTVTDIEVNPRFGSWDAQSGTVVPPEGPRPAPTTTVPLANP
jgi:hypothetical protein